MDPRSEKNMSLVHPELIAVMREAAKTVPFIVINGVRSKAEEALNCAHGASQTMHSRHLLGKCGYACAVDVMALDPHGKGTWAPAAYAPIWAAVQKAAAKLDINGVEWGGAWKTLKDYGHFQLSWALFP